MFAYAPVYRPFGSRISNFHITHVIRAITANDVFISSYHSTDKTIPSKQSQVGVTLNAIMEKTERIQYQAALAITGAWQGSCRSKLYEELGCESLSDRLWRMRILQMHKIVSDRTPSYLKNKLPRLRRPLYRQSNSKHLSWIKMQIFEVPE